MKELSTEDKAKRYDEALAKAAKIHRNYKGRVRAVDVVIEEVFPELKESKDEKIKKVIYGWIYTQPSQFFDSGFSKEEMLAWLEKQGEQKPAIEMKTPEESLGIDSDTYNKIVDECIYGEQKSDDVEEVNFFDDFRKTDSEVEPKFKVGDWVVTDKNNVVQIKSVNNGYYIIDNGMNFNMSYIDRYWHLWTIQDAKDGDVLSDGTTIFIFKDLLSDGSVMSYCDYDTDSDESDAFCSLSMNLMCSKITPATKVQRDILFGGMADDGYTFDFDKKELKKIEQKPAWSKEDERIYSSIMYSFAHNYPLTIQQQEFIKSIKERVQPQPKQEWSKEDEGYYDAIIAKLEVTREDALLTDNEMDFLKSLEGRVQLKQEWSEKDKHMLQKVIDFMNHPDLIKATPTLSKSTINWLEFLEERYTWKPSDEQLNNILDVLSFDNCTPKRRELLESLYHDLKKLVNEK